jgi:vacuolar-type H+-ATPase subunit I/STV1
MPEEEKKQEQPQKPEGTPGEAQPNPNGAVVPEDLQVIKAELEEERKAKAAIEAVLAQRDARITELQATVSVVTQAGETAATELTQAKAAHAKAVSKYLEATRALNSTIPQDIIAGQTIEEIDGSVKKAQSIATAVKANLEAQAKETKVPAGAPTRGGISLEGLTPREKIAAGIHQKGGAS